MSNIKTIKALRPVPRSKVLRLRREAERQAALQRDIEVALYTLLVDRVNAHNVARGVYAEPRAAPSIH